MSELITETPAEKLNTQPGQKSIWRDLVQAARANALPAIGLQSFALFLLWSYHFWPAGRGILEQLAVWKQSAGYLFAFLAAAFGGAFLPFVLQGFQKGNHRRMTVAVLPDLLICWGLRGCLVDAFYQLQTIMWGDNAQPLTLIIKIFCDLMIFSPILAAPSIAFMFSWVDVERDPARFRAVFKDGWVAWYVRDVWPLVRMAWVVWLLALGVIYALPAGLQFPVQVVIQCLWALILVVITDKTGDDNGQAATDAA